LSAPVILLLGFLGAAGPPAQDQTLPADAPLHRGYVLGVLAERSGQRFSVISSRREIFQFRYDRLTWFERDAQRIRGSDLVPGEHLEIVSERPIPGHLPPFARLVHVLPAAQPSREIISFGNYAFSRRDRSVFQAGDDLIFSGIVASLCDGRMTLHTRLDGLKTISLRQDTRFVHEGEGAGVSDLKPNTHVFIRAGRNGDDELEAFQIFWGEIFRPEDVN